MSERNLVIIEISAFQDHENVHTMWHAMWWLNFYPPIAVLEVGTEKAIGRKQLVQGNIPMTDLTEYK